MLRHVKSELRLAFFVFFEVKRLEFSVLPHQFVTHQRVWTGCAARCASAGLAVANSNECNAAARPSRLARRETCQGANAALRPLPREHHWRRGASCLGRLAGL